MDVSPSGPPLWFQAHADLVFFFYGLAFVLAGVAILTQPRRGSAIPLAGTLVPLALFAVLHGANEWLDMWQIVKGDNPVLAWVGAVWLPMSYLFLFEFGRRLLNAAQGLWRLGLWPYLPLGAALVAAALWAEAPVQALHLTGRYLLGLPGGVMAGVGFFLYLERHHRFLQAHGAVVAFQVAGVALLFYGGLGGAVPGPAGFFPADTINTETFVAAFGVPVQVFRALCALALAAALVPILRLFDTEHQTEMNAALQNAETSLGRSRRLGDRLERILDATAEGIVGVDRDGRALFVNPAARWMLGRTEGEILGQPLHDLIHHSTADGRAHPAEACEVQAALRDGSPHQAVEEVFWRGDGSHFPVEYNSVPVREQDEVVGAVLTFRDVTEQRQRELSLRRLNRTHAVLSRCNHVLVHAADELELVEAFCRNVVNIGGYRFVWVGYLQEDAAQSVRPVTHAGYEDGYLDTVDITLADPDRSRGPVGTAIRTGKPAVARDTEEPAFAPWRVEAEKRRYRSAIALPLKDRDRVFGALAIYSGEADAFDDQEVDLLAELAEDLGYGVFSLRDRAGRVRAESTLQIQHRAIESSRNGILITEAGDGLPLVYVNPAFERITGYLEDEVLGRDPALLHSGDRDQPRLNNIRQALRDEREGSAVLRNYRKDGRLFWNELHIAPVHDEVRRLTHWVGVLNDVTEQKRYEAQLEHQANHDDLTGLPNRNLMQDRLQQALAYGHRYDRTVAVLFLDLDRFKVVNDSLGHNAGDELLRVTAERLDGCARRGDTVARLGGDEFVLVLPDVERPEGVSLVAERLLSVVAEPIHLHGHELQMTASIGAALYPRDGRDGDTLLKNADTAMYRAKDLGGERFLFCTEDLNARALERLTLEGELRQALDRQELVLHYQPQVELETGRVVGLEALLRWQHSERGMISPAQFIPLAEETGLIVPIGEWVLSEAARQCQQWRQQGHRDLMVAVNLSARQLAEPELDRVLEQVLAETGLAADGLELELTESAVMSDPLEMPERLQQLRAVGVRIAVDDFGTGYSSLSHLKQFPFDKLKIDRSFVRDIPDDADAAAIARTIMAMAHTLKLRVTAEGVETRAQLDYLARHGCDEIQGFFLGRPADAESVAEQIRQPPFELGA